MKTEKHSLEITISANSTTIGNNWTAYDRVDFVKDSLLMYNLRTLIRDCTTVEFEELLKAIRLYIKTKTERSNVDVYVGEDNFEICKPNKMMPTIWVIKDK